MDVYTEENKKYYYSLGQSRPGEKNGRAKLTANDVYDIRLRRKKGESLKDVYEDYKQLTIGSFKLV